MLDGPVAAMMTLAAGWLAGVVFQPKPENQMEEKMLFSRTRRVVPIVVAWLAVVVPLQAQPYPSQDIHFICAFPPGSGSDVLVRYFAEKVRLLSGRTIIVENRAGAGGNIAMEYVARSKPDGYTIFVQGTSATAASMHLFKKPPVDVPNQLTIAATIHQQPFMLLIDGKSPHRDVAALTMALKAKGDKGSYGAPSVVGKVVAEIYKAQAGLQTVEVNYKVASDMFNDLDSGSLDFAVADPVFSLAQARAGRIRILGVTSGSRLKASSDLPTLTEQGIKMDVTGWWAAIVPARTPKPVVDQINKWFTEVVSSEETKAFLARSGGDPLIETPDNAQARLRMDIAAWGEWVKLAKIQPQ